MYPNSIHLFPVATPTNSSSSKKAHAGSSNKKVKSTTSKKTMSEKPEFKVGNTPSTSMSTMPTKLPVLQNTYANKIAYATYVSCHYDVCPF
ncbi:hypothetical protein INT47_007925 [Mucor saturninus]|uniref:Uncharacterized protein n=1 Tax=Mucor saturninus TaxID=64648 RepID=A0A8H7QKC3_9FUNG|nr:hypothetical protein INT47_007925 [Mucor saturninus]